MPGQVGGMICIVEVVRFENEGRPRLPKFLNMSRSVTSETLLICDGCTLAVERVPEGKMKVRSGTAVVDTKILADRAFELRIRQGQVHVLRRRKVLDPGDQFPNWELGGRPPMTFDDVTSLHGPSVTPSRDVTPSRARNVTPSRERMAHLRRRRRLDQQILKVRINAFACRTEAVGRGRE